MNAIFARGGYGACVNKECVRLLRNCPHGFGKFMGFLGRFNIIIHSTVESIEIKRVLVDVNWANNEHFWRLAFLGPTILVDVRQQTFERVGNIFRSTMEFNFKIICTQHQNYKINRIMTRKARREVRSAISSRFPFVVQIDSATAEALFDDVIFMTKLLL